MSLLITFIAILKTFSISLGVGSSTLAILNFFNAIADGIIDDTERRMMGVVYVVLRVAMVLILVTTVFMVTIMAADSGWMALPAVAYGELITLAVLFINAVLMTLHVMPSTFGPALQAGSWYTLGVLSALYGLGMTDFTLTQFLMAYVTWLVLAIGIVNGVMAMMNEKRPQPDTTL